MAIALMKLAYSEDMGTDHTSFCPLMQGWTEDISSVVDSKGRQVFLMDKPPAEWKRYPEYRPLIYKGVIMLDQKDRPVRDIPGLPWTLSTNIPTFLLAGLIRCLNLQIHQE